MVWTHPPRRNGTGFAWGQEPALNQRGGNIERASSTSMDAVWGAPWFLKKQLTSQGHIELSTGHAPLRLHKPRLKGLKAGEAVLLPCFL